MTERIFKRTVSLIIAILMIFGIICFGITVADAAYAAGGAGIQEAGLTFYLPDILWKGQNKYPVSVYATDGSKVTITKVVSSKTDVIKVVKSGGDYLLSAKKAGKSSITVSCRIKDGPVRTLTSSTAVKDYPNQIKSLKVNGKAVKISKHKYNYTTDGYKGTSVKIKMAVKDGWKITDAWGFLYNKKGKSTQAKVTKAKIKSGKAISFAKKYKSIYVSIKMKNSKGQEINYVVSIAR